MFELSKKILRNVSFDKDLFQKELTKALSWLKPQERVMLHAWCMRNFGLNYGALIKDVYKTQKIKLF